jgi:hypothetical protein
MKRLNRLSTAALLALSVLAAAAPAALAGHDLYPPGWNKPDPNAPKPMFDFRAGWGWDDYQRYWPDQTTRGASAMSRPIQTGPIFYGMTPGGHRFHQQTQ